MQMTTIVSGGLLLSVHSGFVNGSVSADECPTCVGFIFYPVLVV